MTPVSLPQKSRGISLVEIMIGMVIGIIALLVMQQMATTFDKQSRTSASGADAQSTGMIAMHLLENDLKQAGYGIASLNALHCTISSTIARLNGQPFTPTLIIPAGAAATDASNQLGIPPGDLGSDMLVVMYGHTAIMPQGKLVTLWSSATANKFGVEDTTGLVVGDYMLSAQQGQTCTLGRISGPSPMASPVELDHTPPGGTSYTQNTATLFHIGSKGLTINVYAVRNSRLTVCNLWAQDCTNAGAVTDETVWVPISSDIVGLRAQYGWDISSPPDGITDAFCRGELSNSSPNCPNPDPGTATFPNIPCDLARINSIRVALVAQSREMAEGGLNATLENISLWPASAVAPTTNGVVFSVPDRRYRYKSQQTTIPLRNMIWMGAQASCTS
jgi:type IV pilus assembly protein PilW